MKLALLEGSGMVWAALLVSLCSATVLSVAEEIGSPLRVAQCRAGCLQRFSNGPNRGSLCLQGPDCFMCWENCELLQSNFPVWGAMCSEKSICFPGCQEACRFHRDTFGKQLQQSQPVIHTRGEEVVQVTGTAARWPRPPTTDPTRPLVYLVMKRQAGTNTWRQLAQTVELGTRLPADGSLAPSTVRVLVVDPHGLVTIYSPLTTTVPSGSAIPDTHTLPELEDSAVIKVLAGHRKKINTEVTPATARTPVTPVTGSWDLREVSLIHQKVLVIAEVAWEPRVSRGVYLVTWEVDGGGLKGNLFTDSTCVTLSLWPDTVYHIQVELVSRPAGRHAERSSSLRLDTHRAPPVVSSPTSTSLLSMLVPRDSQEAVQEEHDIQAGMEAKQLGGVRRLQLELLAGSGAAILLFLLVLGVTVWHCRRRGGAAWQMRPHKLVEDLPSAGIQPVITLAKACRGLPSQPAATSTNPQLRTDTGVTNPLLQHHQLSAVPEDVCAATTRFLKAAQRGARNEVQV
ncbi:uncharacterized protein [Anabrus simplex]|uniref:uncharacterized protein n=1 Tax=Anabrus simplex TaxID=316456 RepID=UPI0034DCF747